MPPSKKSSKTAPLESSKPTAIFKPTTTGRPYTVSIAIPGSIISNALTHDLKTALAGQIARAAAVFCIDEIVVFNDGTPPPGNIDSGNSNNEYDRRGAKRRRISSNNGYYDDQTSYEQQQQQTEWTEDQHAGWSNPDFFLFHILSYLETPPHLRKRLFPLHPNLRTAGALPSLDMPHHLRADEWCEYREGVTIDPAENNKRRRGDEAATQTLVEAGLPHPVVLEDVEIPPGSRVTLQFASKKPPKDFGKTPAAEAVSPAAPREEGGYYWGYTTRMADNLSSVLTESPFDGGYDYCVGTSERGRTLNEALLSGGKAKPDDRSDEGSEEGESNTPSFRHLLITFGGVAGLEQAVLGDKELREKGVTPENVESLFDAYINVVPGQGSRTIRTEEAIWVTLMGTRQFVLESGR